MSMLWAIASTLQSNKLAMLLVAWALCTLLCTTSATLTITKPVPGDTIDISYPYNVTWTWSEQDSRAYPEIRMQVVPSDRDLGDSYEESVNIITAAGVATFWAAGDVVNAQGMVGQNAQIDLVDPGLTIQLASVDRINIINSLNISVVPSSYSTTIYPATSLATSTSSTTPSSASTTTTSTSASSSAPASTSASVSATATAPAARSAPLSGGAIAGIVIGAVAALAFIATCIAMCIIFGKRRVKYAGVATENNTRMQPSQPETIHEAMAMHSRENIDHSWGKAELPGTGANRGYR